MPDIEKSEVAETSGGGSPASASETLPSAPSPAHQAAVEKLGGPRDSGRSSSVVESGATPATPAPPAPPVLGKQNYEPMYRNVQTALRQERSERKREQAELTKLREAMESLRRTAPTEAASPSAEDNPVGAILHEVGTLRAKLEAQERVAWNEQQQTLSQQHEQKQLETVIGYTRQLETDFAQVQPDYYTALSYAINARKQFHRIVTEAPEHEINRLVADEIKFTLSQAHENNRDPARIFYELALTWGYKPEASVATSGEAIAPVSAALDALASGKEASTTPKGGKGNRPLTLEAYSAMSYEERKALTPEQRRKALETK